MTNTERELLLALLEGRQRLPTDEQRDACAELCRRGLIWWRGDRYRASCKGLAFARLAGYTGTIEHVRVLPDGYLADLRTNGNNSADKRAGDL